MKPATSDRTARLVSAGQPDPGAEQMAARCIAKLRLKDRVSAGLGIEIESGGPGRIVLSMTVAEPMLNAYDICHGGYIFTLADTAFAYAASTRNNVAVGLNCHIDFIRSPKLGDRLQAHAEVSYAGKTTGVTLVRVVDQEQRQIAELHGRYFNLDQAILDSAEITEGLRAEST
jgi:acyl-CoA thioesterase